MRPDPRRGTQPTSLEQVIYAVGSSVSGLRNPSLLDLAQPSGFSRLPAETEPLKRDEQKQDFNFESRWIQYYVSLWNSRYFVKIWWFGRQQNLYVSFGEGGVAFSFSLWKIQPFHYKVDDCHWGRLVLELNAVGMRHAGYNVNEELGDEEKTPSESWAITIGSWKKSPTFSGEKTFI